MGKMRQKASQEAIDIAQNFLLKHHDTLCFEIEHAAKGDCKIEASGLITVYDGPNGDATHWLQFLGAVQDIINSGQYDPELLKMGISLMGKEIRDTQTNIQTAFNDSRQAEARYRIKSHIHVDQPLLPEQQEAIDQYKNIRMLEHGELKHDVTMLLSMQSDLIGLLKSLGITARGGHGSGQGPGRQ